jgi:hypothetical protein
MGIGPDNRKKKRVKKKKARNLLFDAFKLRNLRGCAFAAPVSLTIIKVKESFGDGFVKKSKKKILFFLFVSLVGIGVSSLKICVPCVFCS